MQDQQRAQSNSRRKATDRQGNPIETRSAIPVSNQDLIDKISANDAHDPISDWELADTLRAAIDTLPAQEQAVIRLVYMQGMRQVDVSKRLDITQSRVSQIAAAARQRLQTVLDHDTLTA